MTSPLPGQGDPLKRPVITVMPYALLAVLVGFTVVARWPEPGGLLTDLVLCALSAAWMLGVFTLRPAWRARPPVMAVFVGVLTALMLVLAIRSPWFGCFTPALYVYAYRLLPWPGQLPGVAAVAVVAGTAQAYGVAKDTVAGWLVYAGVVAVNVVPMCLFGWFAWRAALQNEERRRALAELGEANRRLEASLAENAGLQQRLLAQAREAGVVGERQRMAREIHDTLAQGLTGIITQLQAAEYAADDPDGWRRHLGAATGLARESLAEARRSVHELRPAPLQEAVLGEALAGVAERWSALHAIPVQVTTTGRARPMRPEVEVALLRTAQEALANVAKHAGASRVGVTLSYLDHEVALDVRDDGRGFARPPEGVRADGGFGLVAMRQRIEGLAGIVRIESEPGTGTAISASVPGGAGGDRA
ncbi:sensor histidine kinase [Amycolatopsis samaneae]|uniref:Oxygen sensor histidine kinase NreB n=1 Tax=Amycolatopsis samaneae TaxID=664691 RepID=A0ABW5GV05_9PSEU